MLMSMLMWSMMESYSMMRNRMKDSIDDAWKGIERMLVSMARLTVTNFD